MKNNVPQTIPITEPVARIVLAIIATVGLLSTTVSAIERDDTFFLSTAQAGEKRRIESSHRPARQRSYWVRSTSLSPQAEAYYLPSVGEAQPVAVAHEEGAPTLTVEMAMGDGPSHGGNNVYLIDREVIDHTLNVRTAKRTVIQHSCGWGHDHKYEKDRLTHRSFEQAPLEIVCDDLWNGNFHVETDSSSLLSCRTLSYGVPLADTAVRIVTHQGWVKELRSDNQGAFSFELIRDYSPRHWSEFDRRHGSRFLITATHTISQKGEWQGKPYDTVTKSASLPWSYMPSKQEYASYGYGLSVGALFLFIPAAGVYFYRERRKKPFREITFNEKD